MYIAAGAAVAYPLVGGVRGADVEPMTVLLVINTTLDDGAEQAIAAERSPRKDYIELQRALNADVIDLGTLEQGWTRLLRRFAGATVAQGVLAWALSARYDAVFADREAPGFVVAVFSRLRRKRPRLVMIGHLLSRPKKQLLFRALRLPTVIDCIIVHSALQRRIAEDVLGLPPDRLPLVPYHADERFWVPKNLPKKYQICSAGLEYRDYSNLVAAAEGLDVDNQAGITTTLGARWRWYHTPVAKRTWFGIGAAIIALTRHVPPSLIGLPISVRTEASRTARGEYTSCRETWTSCVAPSRTFWHTRIMLRKWVPMDGGWWRW